MKDRLRENWPLLGLKRLEGSSSTEGTVIPSLESPSACLSPLSTFSVPSPTESEEEEISILEEQVAKNSSTYPSPQLVSFGTKGVSQRGDSVFTFSLDTPLETSSLVSRHIDKENRDLTQPTYTASTVFRFELSQQTPNNPLKTKRDHNSRNYRKGRLGRMVVEREPPKTTKPSPQKGAQPAYGVLRQPEFGKTSPLQNRLQSSVFNVTKPNQLRPEHHREVPDGSSRLKNQFINPFSLQQPVQPKFTVDTEDVVEIPRPANHPTWDIHRSVQPVFSSFAPVTGFSAVNSGSNLGRSIDLTGSFDQFNPDRVFPDSRFGDADPYNYIDSGKATENIKALLEGAFEDEDDKPRTRGRKKKVDAALSGLTTQLQGLNVKIEGEKDDQCVNEEEDEEVDDGTVEGLNVKLLPHQVDGVEWMKDKESKVKKKNGILPKGGILADDVSSLIF